MPNGHRKFRFVSQLEHRNGWWTQHRLYYLTEYLTKTIANISGRNAWKGSGKSDRLHTKRDAMLSKVQIISKALSDIEYVRSLEGRLGRLVTEAYVRCLTYTHGKILMRIASLHGMLTINRSLTNRICGRPLGGSLHQRTPAVKRDIRARRDQMRRWLVSATGVI